MSALYHVSVQSLDRENARLALLVKAVHPDSMYISDSIGFALGLICAPGYKNHILGEYVDVEKISDKEWLKKNAMGYIKSCSVVERENEPPIEALHDRFHNYWSDSAKFLKAILNIALNDNVWIDHLKLYDSWDSAMVDPRVEYEFCNPVIPDLKNSRAGREEALLNSLSIDYAHVEGWLAIKSTLLRGYKQSWPDVAYIPKFPLIMNSYTSSETVEAGNVLNQLFDFFHLKTVFVFENYSHDPKFGLCTVLGKNLMLQNFINGKHEVTGIDLKNIRAIGLAQYQKSFREPLTYSGILANANPY